MDMTPKDLIRSRSNNLGSTVYLELRRRILNGEVVDRERIVIDRLAKEFGISSIPIREALARLAAEHMVTFQEKHGYRVAEKPGPEDITQWMEARLMVEVKAAGLAAQRISHVQLEELRSINSKIAALRQEHARSTGDQFLDLNVRFHEILVEACANPHVFKCYTSLHYGPAALRHGNAREVPDLDEITHEHEQIIAALESGNAKRAEDAVTHHIRDGLERMRELKKVGDSGSIRID
jgi:DNA-binding GntR family transcriptional regulator